MIDPARCTGCGWCVAACPPRVLSLGAVGGWQKKSTLHDTAGCTGCALCAVRCPFGAIAMRRLPGRNTRGTDGLESAARQLLPDAAQGDGEVAAGVSVSSGGCDRGVPTPGSLRPCAR